jgi:hypothetical protein
MALGFDRSAGVGNEIEEEEIGDYLKKLEVRILPLAVLMYG